MLVLPNATGFGIAEGVHIDGMIGYQTVARFLTTIHYAASTLTLAMPANAAASVPGAAALDFYFDGTIPRIPVAVDSVATTAEVDTGSRAGLRLSSPFVGDHPQIAAQAKTADGVAGFGVGGPSYAKLGRITSLQIGPYTPAGTVADFTSQQKGAFADPFNPANIGGAIWRRFTVTFDYAHQRMLLAKNGEYDAPHAYDRSGLFLIDNKGAYTVIDARPGTPATDDGLAKGDVILAVEGAPVSSKSLAQLRTILSGPAGSIVHLHVRNAKGERDVALTLRDYV
ncbi:MAG TPA: PDZ domain-containing protein [Candidatus Baltobacteraceae bacterium]|nr:PDZ domain-containing protein [Candidatus Baltobacteraceae bacterium]